jgi:signal transduction histidine kinase
MLDLPTGRSHARAAEPPVADLPSEILSPVAVKSHGGGLAGRILIVTVTAVVVSMALTFAIRLEAAREIWLHNKAVTVQAALDVFDPEQRALPPELAGKVLRALGLTSIAVLGAEGRREIASTSPPSASVVDVTHDENSFALTVSELYHALFPDGRSTIRMRSADPPLELTMDEKPLTASLRRVASAQFVILVMLAVVITIVVWATLWQMVLRPVRKLTSNIIAFGERPQDVSRIIALSGRDDEIGRAEKALAAMQESLANELAQRKRLAELGMAVARINHDLRNMLSAAQLISDRLATIADPQAQTLAPKLVATLDRAIKFCQTTLTYGAGSEQPPERRRFDLNKMVQDVVDAASAEQAEAVDYHVDIPPRFEIYADPDQILRALENLSRNAVEALTSSGAASRRPKAIRFAAIRTDGMALIEISDTGPGFPSDRRERTFEPFQKSTSAAGTGLGLSIAADLVTRNGGHIDLAPAKADDFYCGARFLIRLPTPERAAVMSPRPPPQG